MGKFFHKRYPLDEKDRYRSMSYNRKVAALESCFSLAMIRRIEDFCGDRSFLTESESRFKARVIKEYGLTFSTRLMAYDAEDPVWTFAYIQGKYPIAKEYQDYKKFLFDVKHGKQVYTSYYEA